MNGEQLGLALYIFSFGLGSVLIGVLTLSRTRAQFALTVVLVLVGYALFHADPLTPHIFGKSDITDFAGFTIVALATLALAKALTSKGGPGKDFQNFLKTALQPKLWAKTPTIPSSIDVAKRWFVTVAAATGSLVVALAAEPDFQALLLKSFTLNHLVMAALVTVASLVLIGPVEEYIYGAGLLGETEGEGPGRFEKLVQTMSWRTSARIVLVFVLILMLNVAHSCLEEQLNSRDTQTTLTIVLATVTPAVVTYFWCAALQTGQPHLIAYATLGAVTAGMLLFFPYAVLTVFVTGLAIQAGAGTAYLVIFESTLIALLFGFVLIGLPALFGAFVLRTERNRAKTTPMRTIALISVTLAVLNSVLVLAMVSLLKTFAPSAVKLSLEALVLPGIASSFGWGIGLLVSGFPDILKRAPAATAPAAPTPAPPPLTGGRAEPNSSLSRFFRGQPPGI